MNYYLTLNEIDNIDLSKINIEKKESRKLMFIDDITMECANENELKEYLFSKDLIKEEDLNKNICISYGQNPRKYIPVIYSGDKETIKKIYDMSKDIKTYFNFQKENAYNDFTYSLIMGDYRNIQSHFDSFRVFAGNHKFLRALQEFISQNPKQNVNIKDISIYIDNFSADKNSKVIYIALFEVFRRLFYKYNENEKELEFNYKGFRDFCVFYCEYKKNLELIRQNQVVEQKKSINLDDFDPEAYSVKEPEFPPNSEEEAMYNKYLEELELKALSEPVEEHDHYRR